MDLNHIRVNEQNSIRIEGTQVLYFDPFHIVNGMHDADVIFITHDHYDHYDPESILTIMKDTTIFVMPMNMKKKFLSEMKVPESCCKFYHPGTVHELGNLWIETIPAYNKLKPFHAKSAGWQGYVVKMDDVRYYIAGDTDVIDPIKSVKCDVALIPIGGTYTMDKKHAADYILNLKPKAVIPTHYGSVVGSPVDGSDFKDYIEIVDKKIQVELKL